MAARGQRTSRFTTELLSGRLRDVYRSDAELRVYLLRSSSLASGPRDRRILLGDAGVTGAEIRARGRLPDRLRFITTTGYTTDGLGALAQRWGSSSIFHLLLVGGMAGSTSGGIKTLRFVLGLGALRTFIWRLTHPHAVRGVRYAGRTVPDDVVSGVAVFFLAYLAIAGIAGAIIAAFGYDLVTSMSAALTAIGNVGPGLGGVGPTDNFAHFPTAVKSVLSFCMIAGRLEIFTVLVILEPHFWRR